MIYRFKNTELSFDSPKIMGILNVTPDSFSDGGKYFTIAEAVNYALQMIDEGADIIDIGGESTRPGSQPVAVGDEIKRTIPVIKKILQLRKETIISIDTTKSETAMQALDYGACIINDISGLTFDARMIDIAKQFNAGVVIMHINGSPATMQDNPHYVDVVSEVYEFLRKQTAAAITQGIEKIIIDPGIGFGKRVEDNFELIKRIEEFNTIGKPVMIGLSRKSFIGKELNLNIDERDVATVILETAAVVKSAKIIRTHNVKYCNQMVNLVTKIL